MESKLVTEPGFYNGKYQKAGSHYLDLDSMTKDELSAEAKRRNISFPVSANKADLLKLLKPAAAEEAQT